MAQREGSRTPHEGTIEFISLDSHKGAGESQFIMQASKAQLELLLWQCSLKLGLSAGTSVIAAFQSFTCTWNEVLIWAYCSCLSLGCCVEICHVTPTAARGAGMLLLHLEPWLPQVCKE